MKLLMFTCARGFSVDQETDAVSLFNIVERIAMPGFPCGLPELHIIAAVRRDRDGPDLPLRVVATINEHPLFDAAFELKYSADGRARGVGRIKDVPISEPGELCFALWRGNQKWTEWRIEIEDAARDIADSAMSISPETVGEGVLLN